MVGESLPRDLAASSSVCQSFVCIHRLACWWWTVDTGNKLAGYLRLNIIMNFNYLCFLPTYHSPLQECYYYIQIPPLYMNEPTQSKKYHKLKQNLNGIKEDILAPIRCSLHRLGHDRDGITATRSLPHCIIVWLRLGLLYYTNTWSCQIVDWKKIYILNYCASSTHPTFCLEVLWILCFEGFPA